jgi:LysR family transcriptional regulator, low CO2-responsive transcriptional regulator
VEPQVSLRRLEIFRLVVEEHSVTRAAEILMVAQPAVSSQLRSLETWLGAKLFLRQRNQLVLTEAGRRADVWAKNVLASAAELRRDVDGIESGTGGMVVLAASMGVGTYLLPSLLTGFRESHDGADITLNITQPLEAIRQVEAGEADFAVTSWDASDLPVTTQAVLLRDEPIQIVVRSDRLPAGGALSLEEALQLPLVGTPRGVASQVGVLSQLRVLTDTEPNFVIRLGHAMPAKQAVVDHGWAAFAPSYAVDEDIAAGILAPVEVPGLSLYERVFLVWRHDKVFSKLQSALKTMVRDELAGGTAGRPAG